MGINGSDYVDDTPKPVTAAPEGQTTVMVIRERGRVILRFPEPIYFAAFDANGARNVADCMLAEADLIDHKVTKQERLVEAGRRMRDNLISRVTLMLTSMERDGKPLAYRASHIVDQALQAVQDFANR